MGWTVADLPLPPPKASPKHGAVWLNPDTMEAHLYDDALGRWFKMTQEQYLQYRGKLPPAQHAVSGVVSVPQQDYPKKFKEMPMRQGKFQPFHCSICGKWNCYNCDIPPEEPEEKPITDFGLEDDLFQI